MRKTHLITIVLIAIVFSVFRLSGGDLFLGTKSKRSVLDKETQFNLPDIQDQDELPESDLVDEIIAPTRGKAAKDLEVEDGSKNSLEDIERKLGLR